MLNQLKQFFSSRGVGAYLVGGYLRDSLLSLPAQTEVDIAVPGDPQSTGRVLAVTLGGTYVSLSQEYGVARVVATSGEALRWTIDIKGFSGTIQDDLSRRDFTVDAMASPLQDWDSKIHGESLEDPFEGRQDLAKKQIRAVNPQVFQDDPGRLLRAVRLAARLRFMLEPDTARLVRAESHRITQVSGERVRDEFLALLRLDGAKGHLEVLDRLDLLCRIIPELAITKGVDQPKQHYWDVWGHSLHTVESAELVTKGHQNSPIYTQVPWTAESEEYFNQEVSDGHTRRTILKLAALFHDIAKPQTKKMDDTGRTRFLGHPEQGATIAATRMGHMRFSSRGIAMVSKMVEHHLRPMHMKQGVDVPSRRAVYRYFRDVGDVAVDTLYLSLADHLAAKGPELSTEEWIGHARMVAYVLDAHMQAGAEAPSTDGPGKLVTGNDLMKHFGLAPGPLIGGMLEKIDEAIAAGEVSSKSEALVLASEALRNQREGE
ncbi:MAG: hypothetical protein BZY88_10490 [SAR202 cluster bacterium Io17-Chloro-G9]|nr:MAG: hypothetical protein BZY88_10490 [SAR202 cluster bacterium Io17-Chloro-G9]